MKKSIIIAMLIILSLSIVLPAFADGEGIPVDILKQGGLNDASFGGGKAVSPFIKIINFITGVVAAVLMGYAVYHLGWKTKDLISGKRHWKAMLEDFGAIGISIVVLSISITGNWYELINWFKINVINGFTGAFK
ncbi:MAG: hypothetical protein ACOY46_02965 [Bacillota bacterium]